MAITIVDASESDVDAVDLISTLTNVEQVEWIEVSKLSQIIALANLPKLKVIRIQLPDDVSIDQYVATFLEQYFGGIYFTYQCNNGNSVVKVKYHNRTTKDVDFDFENDRGLVKIDNDILSNTRTISTALTRTVLKKYHSLFGITIDSSINSPLSMLPIPELYKIQLDKTTNNGDYTDYVKNTAIRLINSANIEVIIDDDYHRPFASDNTTILLDSRNNNKLQIIDTAVTLDKAETIINKFSSLKSIAIYLPKVVKDDIDKVKILASRYPQIQFVIVIPYLQGDKQIYQAAFDNIKNIKLA